MDAGRRIRGRYEKLRQSRDLEQGGSLAGYDEGGIGHGIDWREAGDPYLVRTEDFIKAVDRQIERRKRNAALSLGRGREEIWQREVRVR